MNSSGGGCLGGRRSLGLARSPPESPNGLSLSVQAIQHIEGTQDKQELEEEQRRAVIVKSVRSCADAHTSDTASDSEASDSDAMDQSREEPLGDGELP